MPWSCDLHWGNPLVNRINWKHHQVGPETLSENGFSSIIYTQDQNCDHSCCLLSSRAKTGEISREWSVHSFPTTTFAFKTSSVYDGLTLPCKVYYFGEFMGDVHYEKMARIWLGKYKIREYSSMPKNREGAYYIERLLFPGFNYTRFLTTLFCYLPIKH